MKTERDVIIAVDALKEIIDRLTADLDHIEKKQETRQNDIWMYEELEYDIKHLSYKIAVKKARLKALEWVLND